MCNTKYSVLIVYIELLSALTGGKKTNTKKKQKNFSIKYLMKTIRTGL